MQDSITQSIAEFRNRCRGNRDWGHEAGCYLSRYLLFITLSVIHRDANTSRTATTPMRVGSARRQFNGFAQLREPLRALELTDSAEEPYRSSVGWSSENPR